MGWGRGCFASSYKIKKKQAVRGNFNLFHLYFTNENRGGGIGIHATWKRVSEQVRVHGGRGWGPCPPPLEIRKKRLSEEILISFIYILLHFYSDILFFQLFSELAPPEKEKKRRFLPPPLMNSWTRACMADNSPTW